MQYQNQRRTGSLTLQRGAMQLPQAGFLRVRQIVGDRTSDPPIPPIIPVSESTWWAGVKSGRYPQPTRTLGHRITAWKLEDILALIERVGAEGGE